MGVVLLRIEDYGLTSGVHDETPQFLAVKVSLIVHFNDNLPHKGIEQHLVAQFKHFKSE